MLVRRGGWPRRLVTLVLMLSLPAVAVAGSYTYVAPPAWAVGGAPAPAEKPKQAAKPAAKAKDDGGLPAEQRDCRFCHAMGEADLEAQGTLAQKKHRRALDRQYACDRCHDAEEMCCHELVFAQLEAAQEDDDDEGDEDDD